MYNEPGDPRRRHREAFGDPLLASAGLDRLGDHAEVLIITGASYRAQARLKPVGAGPA